VVRAARTYAGKRRQLGFAAGGLYGANHKHKTLRGQENNGGITMLVISRTVRMVMVGRAIHIMMMVVCPTLVMIAGANLDITGEGIGEMYVMMGVINAVHQRDVRLSGQHDGQRHAQNGDRASQRDKTSAQLRLTSGGPTRRKHWQFSTVEAPGNVTGIGSAALPWVLTFSYLRVLASIAGESLVVRWHKSGQPRAFQ
jgi:hypothetical protein